MKDKKTWWPIIFLLIPTVIIGGLSYLSLPYSFTPLSRFLERLFIWVDDCICLCPWWLFISLQILIGLLLYIASRNHLLKRRVYIFSTILVGLLSFLYHHWAHNFYITGQKILTNSVFCRWQWLFNLVLALIFLALVWFKKDTKKKK